LNQEKFTSFFEDIKYKFIFFAYKYMFEEAISSGLNKVVLVYCDNFFQLLQFDTEYYESIEDLFLDVWFDLPNTAQKYLYIPDSIFITIIAFRLFNFDLMLNFFALEVRKIRYQTQYLELISDLINNVSTSAPNVRGIRFVVNGKMGKRTRTVKFSLDAGYTFSPHTFSDLIYYSFASTATHYAALGFKFFVSLNEFVSYPNLRTDDNEEIEL
jgi:hypothetical protein